MRANGNEKTRELVKRHFQHDSASFECHDTTASTRITDSYRYLCKSASKVTLAHLVRNALRFFLIFDNRARTLKTKRRTRGPPSLSYDSSDQTILSRAIIAVEAPGPNVPAV
jgi:hypothetical protein